MRAQGVGRRVQQKLHRRVFSPTSSPPTSQRTFKFRRRRRRAGIMPGDHGKLDASRSSSTPHRMLLHHVCQRPASVPHARARTFVRSHLAARWILDRFHGDACWTQRARWIFFSNRTEKCLRGLPSPSLPDDLLLVHRLLGWDEPRTTLTCRCISARVRSGCRLPLSVHHPRAFQVEEGCERIILHTGEPARR